MIVCPSPSPIGPVVVLVYIIGNALKRVRKSK